MYVLSMYLLILFFFFLSPALQDLVEITLSTEYSVPSHFHDLYIDGKENAKMTGDRMKMLMLTLPFMVRDLIAPKVLQHMYVQVCTHYYSVCTALTLVCSWYVLLCSMYSVELNRAIKAAKKGSRLHGLPPVCDPSNEVVEVLIQCME